VTIQHNGNNLAVVESSPALAPGRLGHAAHSASASEQSEDSIFEIIWRQRAVVAWTTAVCLVLAIGYLIFATRYYSGYAKLFVQQVGPRLMTEEQKQTQDGDTFLFTQKEVMSSTPVIAMTLGTPGVRELKTFTDQDNTFTFFKDSLTLDIGKKDELLSVQFDTPYREDAQRIVAAFVDSYIEYQSKQRHSSSSEVLTVLTAEKEKRQAELLRKQDELQAFRQAHSMLAGTDEATNIVKQALTKIATELTAAQMEAINAKSAWDDVQKSVLNTPERKQRFEQVLATSGYTAPSAVDDQQLRTQLLGAEAQLHTLMSSGRYLPGHPAIQNTARYIDQLNISYAAAVYRRSEVAKTKAADLQASFDQQQKVAIQQNARVVEDTRLAGEVERLAKNVADLDERTKQVALAAGGSGAPNIQVIEPPSASREPTSPHVLRTLALAILAGCVIGCGLAVVRDWYDYRLRNADEIKQSLGITVLGLIPRVADETSPIARGQKIHIDPTSDVAEAYRSLRTAIYFGSKDRPARSILVTSPERGDGKTTLASNLAISMAQAGRRTLLIDADMRAPMQDLIFSMNGRLGLATVLQGKDTPENCVRHTGIENLDLLPAGVAARNPSELLNSQKYIELIESLVEKYDHVVIDSPPLLAVTDARIIAASADATVLVLRAGKSNRKLGELSIDGLVSVGAKLLGAVVNDVQRRGYSSYGGYGRYGYGEDARNGYGNGQGSGFDRGAMVPVGAGAGREEYASATRGNGNGHGSEELSATGNGDANGRSGRLTG
jgi:capsular exopolysaccharide synthesis family protein